MRLLKKHCLKSTCFLLALLLLCLGSGAVTAQQAAAPGDALQAYEGVILGTHGYVQCNLFDDTVEEAFMPGEIGLWYGFEFDPPLQFLSFAVTDLDSDGSPELLLQLSEDFGYELLRYENGLVYGFPFFARAMEAVTADGEIHGSNGADNFGWYRVYFEADKLATADVCWKFDDLGSDIQYFIGDTEGSESDFTAMNDALWNKEALEWTEFTLDNLHAAVTGE